MSLLNPNQPTGTVAKWITHDGKRFGAASFEIDVNAPIDDVWTELADNYIDISKVTTQITNSHAVDGEPTKGPGAARHCDLTFHGRKVAIKERIIDWIDTPDHREYTYFVYETKGFPATVYNTWSVRAADDGTVKLRNVFYFRMKPAAMSRAMFGQMSGAAKTGVLGFKHYVETGEQVEDPKRLVKDFAA